MKIDKDHSDACIYCFGVDTVEHMVWKITKMVSSQRESSQANELRIGISTSDSKFSRVRAKLTLHTQGELETLEKESDKGILMLRP